MSTHNVYVTLGASNHTVKDREENDYYATDPKAMELLLEKETFSNDIWECACGAGDLSKVLEAHGYNVLSTDLIYRNFGRGGVDFFNCHEIFDGDIITNPPYKYAKEFCEHALELVPDGHKVAMFLRLNFLEGKSRRKLFNVSPPKIIYVASGRITCYKNGFREGADVGAQAYAWYIWEKGYKGDTVVKWFN